MTSPYAFTEEELKMMDKNYKKPKVYNLYIKDVVIMLVLLFLGQKVVCVREKGGCC